jgi:hypothetical protein
MIKRQHLEGLPRLTLLRASSPGINSAYRTHAQGEESLWSGHLMSSGKRLFAYFLLPKCCEPKAKHDPKHNIPGVV